MKNKTAEIEISSNFGQDEEQAKKFGEEVSEILKPFKESGLLDFKKITIRKCDFCEKELKEGDNFKTIGEKDKCEDCQKEK